MDFGFVSSPALRRFAAYWLTLRGARQLPARADLDPMRVAGLLSDVWLYRFEPERDDWICRIAGDSVARMTGAPMQHRALREIFNPETAAAIRQRMDRIAGEPAALHTRGRIYRLQDRMWVGERLGLPLLDRAGRRRWVFGISDFDTAADFAAGGRAEEDEEIVTYHRIS